MKFIRASFHKMEAFDGSEVGYVRVLYRKGNTFMGYSVLPHRVSPEILAASKACQ